MFKRKSGFTLVEMLIVIVIIGILAAALIPRLTGVQGNARDAARKASLNQIGTAILQYQANFGQLPDSIETGLNQYMTSVPKDPQTNIPVLAIDNVPVGSFGYMPIEKNGIDGSAFVLAARVEGGGSNANWFIDGNENQPTDRETTATTVKAGKIDKDSKYDDIKANICTTVEIVSGPQSFGQGKCKVNAGNQYYIYMQ